MYIVNIIDNEKEVCVLFPAVWACSFKTKAIILFGKIKTLKKEGGKCLMEKISQKCFEIFKGIQILSVNND